MKMDGGQALIKSLEMEGVEVLFGLPGGAILPVYDPIIDSSIRHILVRHEQGAGHMAEGYAHVTGRPGVAMVTSGPAATNIVTPLADAYMDSVPMVCITGQVPYAAIGTDAFQECDTIGITRSVTKHNELVTSAQDIPRAVREAFRDRVARFEGLFVSVEDIDPHFAGALDVFWYLRGVYMLAKHEAVYETYTDDVNPNVRSNVAAALKMDARSIGWAAREQYRLMHDFHAYMAETDIMICPAVTVTPFPFAELYPKEIDGAPMENYVHWAAMTSTLTVTGNPVVAIPCGLDEYGTPFGIQIVGKIHRDREVLAIASAIEQAFQADPLMARPVPELARAG